MVLLNRTQGSRLSSGFATKHVTPLRQISPSLCVMEQFHGPTCAFKDVALQFLGNLFECVFVLATSIFGTNALVVTWVLCCCS